MLQETKKSEINKQCLSSFERIRNIDWVFSPAEKLAGVLMITLEKGLLEVQQREYSISSLSVKLKEKKKENHGGYPTSTALQFIQAKQIFGPI